MEIIRYDYIIIVESDHFIYTLKIYPLWTVRVKYENIWHMLNNEIFWNLYTIFI